MKVARVIYLMAGALACAAAGSAIRMWPVVGILWAVVLTFVARLIGNAAVNRGRASRAPTSVPSPAAEPTVGAQPTRWIFFDSDLPESFFTGESERAREIAAGAEWTKDAPGDDDSADDADLSVLRFAMPRLYAAALRAAEKSQHHGRESGVRRMRRRPGLQPPLIQRRRGNDTNSD
jgi:hypothetical protein